MAKKTLESAIDELMKNYESALKEAVEYASNEAIKDIYKESMSCLERYYDSYDPTSYNRTDNLWRAVVPCLTIQQDKDKITSVVGVEYDASQLMDIYYSGSERYGAKKNAEGHIVEYGHPDGAWVLNNYLSGIHPATNGKSNPQTVAYYENVDPISPTTHMIEYLNNYANTTFHKNIIISFAKQIRKMN